MKAYIELGKHILANGNNRIDRTTTGTRSVFGAQTRFDLQAGFPLLTTKKMFLKGIIHELLWFLQGDTNNNTLKDQGVNIWNEWVLEDGSLGKIYGAQWRMWDDVKIIPNDQIDQYLKQGYDYFDETYHSEDQKTYAIMTKKFDQISELIENLKKKPFSRRHVISAWNVTDLPDETISPQENVKNDKMALAPCHCLFQFYVRELSFDNRCKQAMNIDSLNKIVNSLYKDVEENEELKKNVFKDELIKKLDEANIPKYYLDCQLYQR